MFDSIRETIDYSVENNISFADMMINDEMEREGKSREEVRDLMRQNLNVMREAVEKGTKAYYDDPNGTALTQAQMDDILAYAKSKNIGH